MDEHIKRIVKQAIESYGYEVRVDEDSHENILYVDDEDTTTGVRITIEVVP